MRVQEHIETARDFLDESDREFSEGKDLQASEKLWGAASHAVMAVAQQHGWPYGSHRAMKTAADRLGEIHDDSVLRRGLAWRKNSTPTSTTDSWRTTNSTPTVQRCATSFTA